MTIRALTASNGVLIIDKPTGLTSHDVVSRVRRFLHRRDVGHAGTLDPAATGVLLVMFGESLKLSSYLTSDHKCYQAIVAFGVSTTTSDAEGELVAEQQLALDWLTEEKLAPALSAELLRTEQIPPAFSSIKVNGKRSHRLARSGQDFELPPRPVVVSSLELICIEANRATIRITCSKGYYVRSFAVDLGASLGVPSHLCGLRRLSSGKFSVDEAVPWPLPEDAMALGLEDATRRCLGVATLTETGVHRAHCGLPIAAEHFVCPPDNDAVCGWFDEMGNLRALGQQLSEGQWRVVRGIHRETIVQEPVTLADEPLLTS